jgi:molecular chaperone IbpA
MTYDFAPLFRTAIGFDRLARLADTLPQDVAAYPPYNIERLSEDGYRVTLAVAGFAPEEVDVTVKDNALLVSGRVAEAEAPKSEFLHRGIAARAFSRRFLLADHMVVEGAAMANGLLHVQLRRVIPESARPRKIAITTAGTGPATLEPAKVAGELLSAA